MKRTSHSVGVDSKINQLNILQCTSDRKLNHKNKKLYTYLINRSFITQNTNNNRNNLFVDKIDTSTNYQQNLKQNIKDNHHNQNNHQQQLEKHNKQLQCLIKKQHLLNQLHINDKNNNINNNNNIINSNINNINKKKPYSQHYRYTFYDKNKLKTTQNNNNNPFIKRVIKNQQHFNKNINTNIITLDRIHQSLNMLKTKQHLLSPKTNYDQFIYSSSSNNNNNYINNNNNSNYIDNNNNNNNNYINNNKINPQTTTNNTKQQLIKQLQSSKLTQNIIQQLLINNNKNNHSLSNNTYRRLKSHNNNNNNNITKLQYTQQISLNPSSSPFINNINKISYNNSNPISQFNHQNNSTTPGAKFRFKSVYKHKLNEDQMHQYIQQRNLLSKRETNSPYHQLTGWLS